VKFQKIFTLKKIFLVLLLVLHAFSAEFIVEDINNSKKSSTWIMLPYIFSSETMGLTAGGVAIFSGFIQLQIT